MDWFAPITALATVIVPSVVSIVSICCQAKTNKENNNLQLEINKLNNNHELEIKQLDFIYNQKNVHLSSYIDCLVKYLNSQTDENLENYQISLCKISMYVSSKVFDEIIEIDNLIKNANFEDAKYYLLHDFLNAANIDAIQSKNHN